MEAKLKLLEIKSLKFHKDCECDYEMVCKTADYFSKKKIVSEIIIKFRMEDPKKKYHLPIIISPNGYSIWWSQ